MKFIHISDLHLGRKIYEYSMLDEQKNALTQVLKAVDDCRPEGVLIAGDVYDKSIPSIEAMELFEWFLMELVDKHTKVFVISGNHDSVERVSFGADVFKKSGIYIAKAYDGHVPVVSLEDEHGTVCVHMIPFVKPAIVKKYHEENNVTDYNSALAAVVSHIGVDKDIRNIAMVHQFITGAKRSDSEETFLGGLDNVDYEVFADFDYVALGHIHKPQSMGRKCVRYSGSPIKYSIDEIKQKKSITLVELKEKGEVVIETIPFIPSKDIRRIEGTYMELTDRSSYIDTKTDDYLHVVLKDEQDVPDALRKLRVIYPNILKLEYSNKRTASSRSVTSLEHVKQKGFAEYVSELYEIQNNQGISLEQMKIVEKYWEESKK